jgi:ribonuclease HII
MAERSWVMSDTEALYVFDTAIQRQHTCRVIGIDEAGRGPLAGPVVAAAVILDLNKPIEGVDDSKKIRPEKRACLFDAICAGALAWSVGEASHEEIDKINILQATFLAMKRALDGIQDPWSLALVDGNQYIPLVARSVQMPIVKGDAKSASVAAASIIAKVTRDRIMERYHREFPGWDFSKHKGYPTARHRLRIEELGLCAIHRKSFCTKFRGEQWLL